MSEYDDDFDSLDAGILAEMDAFEAKVNSLNQNHNTNNVGLTKRAENSSKNALNEKEVIDIDDIFDDLTMDIEDMDTLEAAASKQTATSKVPTTKPAYNPDKAKFGSTVAGSSNSRSYSNNPFPKPGTMSGSLQTNLHGDIVYPSSPPAQQPRNTGKRPAFGQRIRKSKVWDQTAFAKSGWKSTKAPTEKKSKARKGDGEGDGDVLDVDFEDLPTPFMPCEFHSDFVPLNEASTIRLPDTTRCSEINSMHLQPDRTSMREWIFPLNRAKRDYQYSIVKASLFDNTLVALPTGLGKTFIAGCVMLNFYRWFPEGKIIFVAPTKPLVAQQIEACHETCGIPGTEAIELTGLIPRETRAVHWQTKRVFYMTPQTLVNDLATGISDPKKIILLVVDEAHKGTGDYAYAQIVRFMMATNPFFRLMALTATPGSKPEVVQTIVDSLHISHIEIRNEESMDVRKYMHQKTITQHLVDLNDALINIREHLLKLITSVMKPLAARGIIHFSNPNNVKDFVCNQAMTKLGRADGWAFKPLATLGALARILGYLSEFSVAMAYHALQDLGQGIKKTAKKEKKEPTPNKIVQDSNFIAIIKEIERQRNELNHFPTHPKMEKLRALAIQHFAAAEIAEEEKARPGQSAKRPDTKMIVYCTYRECVDEIVEMLNEQRPMIRPHRFIGQGTDKRGTKGVTQKEQIAVINDFKEGKYNVIVATSIGEEGLDIGEVESIVCYDTSKAAIRTVQRAGRTGRKKAGKVEVLLTKGREDSNWEKATDAYKQVQQSIVQGIDLELYGDVPRFLPDGVEPQCLEKTMECIPYEREEAKSRGNSFNSRKTSGKLDSIGTKSSRKRTRLEEPEEDSNENEGPDSSPKRKKRFVQSDSEDEDLKLSKKRKKSNTKKDREGSLLKSSASHTRSAVPSTAFVSARSIAAEDTNDVNHDDAPLEKKPTKRTVKLPDRDREKAAAKTASKPVETSMKRKKAAPSKEGKQSEWNPPSKLIQSPEQRAEKMKWLFESDSDSQREAKKTKPFKAHKETSVIDLDDSEDSEPNIIHAGPQSPLLKNSANERPVAAIYPPLPRSSSPDISFPPRRLARRRPATVVPAYDESIEYSPSAPRRLKRKDEQEYRDLMPPPPRPQPVDNTAEEGFRNGGSARDEIKPIKHSIFDHNDLLEIEAIHSGDEVDAGSSDSEGMANSSDIDFLVDTSTMSQVPDGYDQSAVYRQGLLTQAPMGGPSFASRPVRVGFLGRGRRSAAATAHENQGNVAATSSSPFRASGSDNYSVGSFVVGDEEEIEFEESSQT